MASRIEPQIDVVSVSATKTLATLLGAALNTSTKKVTLRPHAVGIYMDNGTATAADDPLGSQAITFDADASALGTLQFFAAAATNMTVIQEG